MKVETRQLSYPISFPVKFGEILYDAIFFHSLTVSSMKTRKISDASTVDDEDTSGRFFFLFFLFSFDLLFCFVRAAL